MSGGGASEEKARWSQKSWQSPARQLQKVSEMAANMAS